MTPSTCCPHRTLERCLTELESIHEPALVPPRELAALEPCLFARLKQRIIRLRREGNADWPWFRQEVAANADLIAAHVNTRWLVSILDTFADHGSPVERRNAMCVSLLVNWEKLALTERLATGTLDAPTGHSPEAMDHPQPLWDGISTMVMTRAADVLPNMFRRLDPLVAESPLVHRFFVEIVNRMLDHERSTVRRLASRHERPLADDVRGALGAPSSAVDAPHPDQGAVSEDEYRRLVLEALQGLTGGLTALFQRQEALHAEACRANLATSGAVESVASAFDRFAAERFARHAWASEMRDRDLLEQLGRLKPLAPVIDIELVTEHPVAAATTDHRYPHGTARDNTRAPWFAARCEELFGRQIDVLDLGCAGGGLVLDFNLRGHRAVGLEGSDFSRKRLRAEWRLLGDRLFTCDVARPFELIERGTSKRKRFDMVMAWDVLEHIGEGDLDAFFANVRTHLAKEGLFVGSISTRASGLAPDGTAYHATVQPRAWWEERFAEHGLTLVADAGFLPDDFPRGNASAPGYAADFTAEPGSGFHFVARPSAVRELAAVR